MALIVDAGAILAQADTADPWHRAAVAFLRDQTDDLATTQVSIAEADYLILDRLGVEAELRFLRDLTTGTFVVECLTDDELATAGQLVERYKDLEIGLADASLVTLASRLRTRRIMTFDERHFRAVAPLQGGHFEILPADA